MTLKELYNMAVQEGMNVDPRGRSAVDEILAGEQSRHASLKSDEKKYYDTQRLSNPYDDTRIVSGAVDSPVKKILVGIDVDTSDLLLADRLNASKQMKIDAVVSHHPLGCGFANFYEVMSMQADIFHSFGVPINISEALVDERKREVARRIHAANHYRVADAASLLGIPLMCTHTVADNHAVYFLQNLFDERKPKILKDILDLLFTVEEYAISSREHVEPCILFGKPDNRTGRIFVDMTGGTEGPKDIIDNLVQAGVGTIVGMHLSEDHYKKYQTKHVNVIIAGHMASDNLGMNLLFDKLQRAAELDIVAFSGFRRVRR